MFRSLELFPGCLLQLFYSLKSPVMVSPLPLSLARIGLSDTILLGEVLINAITKDTVFGIY